MMGKIGVCGKKVTQGRQAIGDNTVEYRLELDS